MTNTNTAVEFGFFNSVNRKSQCLVFDVRFFILVALYVLTQAPVGTSNGETFKVKSEAQGHSRLATYLRQLRETFTIMREKARKAMTRVLSRMVLRKVITQMVITIMILRKAMTKIVARKVRRKEI